MTKPLYDEVELYFEESYKYNQFRYADEVEVDEDDLSLYADSLEVMLNKVWSKYDFTVTNDSEQLNIYIESDNYDIDKATLREIVDYVEEEFSIGEVNFRVHYPEMDVEFSDSFYTQPEYFDTETGSIFYALKYVYVGNQKINIYESKSVKKEDISKFNRGDIIDAVEVKFKDGRSTQIDTSYLDISVDALNDFLKMNSKKYKKD